MNEFGGSPAEELLKNAILSFSGLGLGAALYMGVYDIRRGLRAGKGHVRRLWYARATFVFSFVTIVGLLTALILPSEKPIPVTWQALTYTAGVLGGALGGIGMAWESRKVNDTKEAE